MAKLSLQGFKKKNPARVNSSFIIFMCIIHVVL